jgi:biotin transport system permease protein
MLTLTCPFETPFHRLRAGTKLGFLALFTLGLFWLRAPVPLAAALGGLAGLHLLSGPRLLRFGLAALWPLWPFLVVVGAWHLWQGDPRGGAAILLRLCSAVMAANLVTMTTRLEEMIDLVERLARPLGRLGLSPKVLALAVALVIRFIPVLAERMGRLRQAWAARSPRRAGWRILVPAALATLDDADRVAEALRARGGAG